MPDYEAQPGVNLTPATAKTVAKVPKPVGVNKAPYIDDTMGGGVGWWSTDRNLTALAWLAVLATIAGQKSASKLAA